MSGLRLSTSGNSELAGGTRFLPASWALGTVSIEAENTSSGSSEAPIPPPPGPTLLTLWAPRSFTPKMSWAEMFPAPWTGAGSFEHVWLGDRSVSYSLEQCSVRLYVQFTVSEVGSQSLNLNIDFLIPSPILFLDTIFLSYLFPTQSCSKFKLLYA